METQKQETDRPTLVLGSPSVSLRLYNAMVRVAGCTVVLMLLGFIVYALYSGIVYGWEHRPRDFAGADLHGRTFARISLDGSNFERANLRRADLSAAGLSGANFHGANLAGASLTGARLVHADLSGADLRGANLADADLTDANLIDVQTDGTRFDGADMVRARYLPRPSGRSASTVTVSDPK